MTCKQRENSTLKIVSNMAALERKDSMTESSTRSTFCELTETNEASLVASSDQLFQFDKREIVIGALLGKGGFCDVYEVKGFCRIFPEKIDKGSPPNACLWGKFYAIKTLRRHSADNSKAATASLVQEVNMLSCLDHPHIIGLQGIVADMSGIVLDRLHETLQERLVKWKGRLRRERRKCAFFLRGTTKRDRMSFFRERLSHARDLASALTYLHKKHIAHRDIKIGNIGFTAEGSLKIFDFGLSKHILENSDGPSGGSYCGTPRYMAPEVSTRMPYTTTCDVFSFTIVLWEMMTCERAFAFIEESGNLSELIAQGGYRPSLWHQVWSTHPFLIDLVEQGWEQDPRGRPSMALFHIGLQAILDETA